MTNPRGHEYPAQTPMFAATATDERAEEPDKASREDLPTPPTLIAAIFADLVPYLIHVFELRNDGATLVIHGRFGPLEISEARPFRVLDVCCGYGAFAMMLAAYWVRVLGLPREWLHITGVEIKPEREKHMRKWCDHAIVSTWTAALHDRNCEPCQYDLIVSNPHFTALTHDDPAQAMPPVLTKHAPNVALLHTNNALQRGEPGRAVERAYPPAVSWRVPGTVSFDGTSSVASDCYTVSLWRAGHEGPTSTQLLSTDPKAANLEAGILKSNGEPYACWRWTVPPGTEEPSKCEACAGQGGSEEAGDCPDCNGSGLDPNGDLPTAPGYVSKRKDGREENDAQPAHEVT